MDTVASVMSELKRKGSEQTRKTYRRHGAPDEMFGVKVGDLKPIAMRIRGQQALACALYETGNSDAMYLAGLVADGAQMNKRQLNAWAKSAGWYMISEYTVPGVAAESPHAREFALKWISSKQESVAACGWCTYAGIVATRPDDKLDLEEIKSLLKVVIDEIHDAPNRVRYCMNGFVISVGAYIKPLLRQAKSAAKKIGKVDVDVGDTSCKVPLALEYIEKVETAGRVGKKRKTMKC
jgi:3-methyladenine DNA glycosylase AlkD